MNSAGFPEIRIHPSSRSVSTEGEGIGSFPVHRDAQAVLLILHERNQIEKTQTHRQIQPRTGFPDSGGDFPEEACPVFKGPAVRTFALDGAEKLVRQIPVRVFDVDEIESCLLGNDGTPDKSLYDFPDFPVREHIFLSAVEFFVQQRMCISCGRQSLLWIVRMGESAGMSQLESDQEVFVRSRAFPVDPAHFRTEAFQRIQRVLADKKLPRIASPAVHDRSRLRPADEFCAG